MPTSPSPVTGLDSATLRSPPEGRRTLGCTCVHSLYRSRGADEDDTQSATMAGSMPAWAPLRSDRPDGTCPADVAQRDGERDRHPSDFGWHRHDASDSPMPARMAGEATAEPGRRSGARIGKGHPCNRVQALPSVVNAIPRPQVLPAVPRFLPQGFGRGRGHDRPDLGSEPVVGGVGARARPCSCGRREPRPSRRGQGRPEAEREAKPGDVAELVEAPAEPNTTTAAPRSVP